MELLAVRGVSKYYAETDTLANHEVSLTLGPGEIRAVVGENGAGKSTLARIVCGLVAQDAGEVLIRGLPLPPGNVRAAERAGIGLVPQHSLLAEGLSVAEAIALGREPRRAGFLLDRRRAYVEAAVLAERFGFQLDPAVAVGALSPALRRQAELMRALARGGEVLVLDEPTALLTEAETAGLFVLLRRLAEAGKAVLYITHRAAEIRSLATSLTVLRLGRVVADRPATGIEDCELAALMANIDACGRSASAENGDGEPPITPHETARAGDAATAPPLLEARDILLDGPGAAPFSFGVHPGEILGIIAHAGNGLDQLEAVAAGLARPRQGAFIVCGRPISACDRGELRSRLLSYVPADREGRGLALAASVADNLLVLERHEFGPRAHALRRLLQTRARELAARGGLSAALSVPAAALSGGNRQRLVLARELDSRRPAAILVDPTQGLDVAAYDRAIASIRALKQSGAAILLLTSSLDELLALADRIGVLYRGALVHLAPKDLRLSGKRLAALMTGLEAA